MKFDNDKCVNIKTVCEYLGDNFSENLLKFHSLIGCVSKSYFYCVGTGYTLEEPCKNPEKINFIFSLGIKENLPVNNAENCQWFV